MNAYLQQEVEDQQDDQRPAYYSVKTLEKLRLELPKDPSGFCMFLSTAPVYFSLLDSVKNAIVLCSKDAPYADILKCNERIRLIDLKNGVSEIPEEWKGKVEFVFAEPEFIDQKIWEVYHEIIQCVKMENAKVLVSTTAQNEDVLKRLSNLEKKKFQPNIPGVIYQYSFFTNYESENLDEINEELKVEEVVDILEPVVKKVSPQLSKKISDAHRIRRVDKNLELLKKFPKPNLAFYQNKLPSIPHGDKIDNIHKVWWNDFCRLEMIHSYIQWLFPMIGVGGMNYYCRGLTPEEATEISNDPEAKDRVLKSYEMMLNFYGIKLLNKDSGEVARNDIFDEREKAYTFHNNLRITRILTSLGALGFQHYQRPLVEFFVKEILEKDSFPSSLDSLMKFWIQTLPEKDAKEILESIKENHLLDDYIKRNHNKRVIRINNYQSLVRKKNLNLVKSTKPKPSNKSRPSIRQFMMEQKKKSKKKGFEVQVIV